MVDERTLRHYGHLALDLAAELELVLGADDEMPPALEEHGRRLVELAARQRVLDDLERRPVYTPTGPVAGGVELGTGRWACCGAWAAGGDGPHAAYCPTGPRVTAA